MRVVVFCHSLISDWNHGNAHFLRGVCTELLARGHTVAVYEPSDSWSRRHLLAEAGPGAIARFHEAFPDLAPRVATYAELALDEVLQGADIVVVHEWNPHTLVAAIGRHHARGGQYALLFHDTHHRSVTSPGEMAQYDLDGYDGVLAFGEVIRQRYLALGWARRAWAWHEAADTRVFRPLRSQPTTADLIWIGNWGDDERTAEIREYLIRPVEVLGLRATINGVRYPDEARRELSAAGIHYGGWLANYEAPAAYARHLMTVHIPRRPYVVSLPGVPTIRVFEALACGVPLVSVKWDDVEGLFTPGEDYLVAETPEQMRKHLAALRADAALRDALIARGLDIIGRRHTCRHRVDELLTIAAEVRGGVTSEVLPV